MVWRPSDFVRLSVICDVVLNSIDGRNWLLPSWFKPAMKNVPNPPLESACGTPGIPN